MLMQLSFTYISFNFIKNYEKYTVIIVLCINGSLQR